MPRCRFSRKTTAVIFSNEKVFGCFIHGLKGLTDLLHLPLTQAQFGNISLGQEACDSKCLPKIKVMYLCVFILTYPLVNPTDLICAN